MKPKQNNREIKGIECCWIDRTNALIDSMIDYCKQIQYKDSLIYKQTNTPIISTLDNIILELQKHKIIKSAFIQGFNDAKSL